MSLHQTKSTENQQIATSLEWKKYIDLSQFSYLDHLQSEKLSLYDLDNPEQLNLMDSIDTYEYDKIQNHLPENYDLKQLTNIKKPRKKRRREIHHDKYRKRGQKKRILKKHEPIPFDVSEDKKILLYVLEMGPKFYKIAKNFPGRTLSMVKNRYYKTLRFQWDVILGQTYSYLNFNQTKEEESQNQFIFDLDDQCFCECSSQYYLPIEY